MSMTGLVMDQVVRIAGRDDPRQEAFLQLLCQAVTSEMTARLREGLHPEDCRADFVVAAGLYVLAALAETDENLNLQHIQVGDLTVKPGGGENAARCMREQAARLLQPYCADNFSFRGV